MINRHMAIILAVSLFSYISVLAQNPREKGLEAITEQAVQGQLEFLSSDWTEGRSTGQPGAYMAADYIASMFKVYGLQPAGDMETIFPSWQERREGKKPRTYRTFFQGFDLIEYKAGEKQHLSLTTTTKGGSSTLTFGYKVDFSLRGSDVAVDQELPVVFAGYGYADEEKDYNDFKGLDVKGKLVICLHGYPGHQDTTSKAYRILNPEGKLSGWSLYRKKIDLAEKHGVAAIIEIPPEGLNHYKNWASNIPFRYNTKDYEGEEPRASYYETRQILPGAEFSSPVIYLSVSKRITNAILEDSGIDPEAFAKEVATSLKPASREIKEKTIRIKTTVDSKVIRARNVVGVIPGRDTSEIIVIGGHYDHLGIHDGWIWNGADDNASGTVGVMTMAKAFMASGEKPEKTIVFAAWTGEEKGLLGSRYFSDNPYNDTKVLLNLNYDMISRDDKDDTLGIRCGLNYTAAYPLFEKQTKKYNEEFGFGLEVEFRPSPKPRGGSDHSSFSRLDIPVMYFEAGFPPEYHQAADHIDLVNFDKMVKIIKLGYLNIWELANTDWFGKTEEKD